MDLTTITRVLLWTAAAHYALLLLSFVLFVRMEDTFYRLQTRWLHVSREQYRVIAYLALALYKIAIWLFFLVPGLVLLFLG